MSQQLKFCQSIQILRLAVCSVCVTFAFALGRYFLGLQRSSEQKILVIYFNIVSVISLFVSVMHQFLACIAILSCMPEMMMTTNVISHLINFPFSVLTLLVGQ